MDNKTFDFSSKKRIFCPKTTQFGPKLAFFSIAGSFDALLVGWLVVVVRAVSHKTTIYFIQLTISRKCDHGHFHLPTMILTIFISSQLRCSFFYFLSIHLRSCPVRFLICQSINLVFDTLVNLSALAKGKKWHICILAARIHCTGQDTGIILVPIAI